jgi:DNA (cytosine-5)-methyltransferase 1
MKYTFIDLFAGIGGFRTALEANDGECVYSVEWNKYAQAVYEYNYGEKPTGDITKISEHDIPEHDILCGGFPCQAFSISGSQQGFNDTRGTLFFDIARILKAKRPKVLFLENVKNLLKHDNGKTIKVIKKVLKDLGYNVKVEVLNASKYGVPQKRERVFIVGFRKDLVVSGFEFPQPTNKEIYIDDIIEDENVSDDYVINRPDTYFNDTKDKIDKGLIPNDRLKPIRVGSINKGGQGERIYSGLGHAITLSAYGGGIAGKTGAYLINDRVRKLTPRECLRVQGFSESFKFPEAISRNQRYQMCGNSVSVPVIDAIYKKILLALECR